MASLSCSDEVIGLSVALGLAAATAISSFAWFCWIRPYKNRPCPYCEISLPPQAIREHLQSCKEHAAHYMPKQMSQRSLLRNFVVKNPGVP